MSFSGMLFTICTAFAAVNTVEGNDYSTVLWLLGATVFMWAAIYHDDEQEKRIAKLEKELAKRGKDDG